MAELSSADYRGSLGRYALYGEIAAGGMATVHLARLLGPVGFARTCAIKRLHPHLAKDPEFVAMFLEEARLAARVRHPNVVATLDVVSDDGELFLVMEYVAGESLSRLVRKTRESGHVISARYVVGIMCGALDGLHAAHEAKSEKGQILGLVHRDVSPQNIHVGLDGVARVLDFGIAKATNRVQETRTDQIKGKVAYMSPEQLAKGAIDRRADVYSASVVLWEALTGERLFKADDIASLVYQIVNDELRPPSSIVPTLPAGLDEIVMKGLDREAENRWSSAREMAMALEKVLSPAPPREVGEWAERVAGDALEWRQELVHRIESETSSSIPPPMRHDSPASPIEISSGVRPTDSPSGHSIPDDERATLLHANGRSMSTVDEVAPHTDRSPAVGQGRAQQSRLSLVAMVIAGALLVAGAATFALRWFQMQSADPQAAADAAIAILPSSEPAVVIEKTQRTGGHPSASAGVASPSASASSAAITAPVNSIYRPPVWVKPPPSATTTPNECADPFTVDARGVKHPKPQCFKK